MEEQKKKEALEQMSRPTKCDTCKHSCFYGGSNQPDDPPNVSCMKGHFDSAWPVNPDFNLPYNPAYDDCPDFELYETVQKVHYIVRLDHVNENGVGMFIPVAPNGHNLSSPDFYPDKEVCELIIKQLIQSPMADALYEIRTAYVSNNSNLKSIWR